jgi:selenocysteine lyase/cysteine desulfurase
MSALGLDVMTPAEPARRAANAAFAHADSAGIMRRAEAEGILLWADHGRVRASAHVFTGADDVARFLERLPALLRPGG